MRRALSCLLTTLLAAPAAAAPVTEVHYVMGTLYRITADAAARPVMRRCFQEARRLEEVFSRFLPDSELSAVNGECGGRRRVSPDFARLLRQADRLRAATDGRFDVTIGPLSELWRRTDGAPTPGEVAAARAHVGPGRARLDGELLALAPGARLDFDGIAKGYAVDRCVDLLRAAGVERALVSLGESSLYGLGAPDDAPDWAFVVRASEPELAVGVLHLRDAAASISSTRSNASRHRAPHIVDPRSGVPVAGDALAVVVAGTATDAEAYTKALLLWGARGARELERRGARGAVHVEGGVVHEGARARRLGCFEPGPPERMAALPGEAP